LFLLRALRHNRGLLLFFSLLLRLAFAFCLLLFFPSPLGLALLFFALLQFLLSFLLLLVRCLRLSLWAIRAQHGGQYDSED
jgi:hypothetical protein